MGDGSELTTQPLAHGHKWNWRNAQEFTYTDGQAKKERRESSSHLKIIVFDIIKLDLFLLQKQKILLVAAIGYKRLCTKLTVDSRCYFHTHLFQLTTLHKDEQLDEKTATWENTRMDDQPDDAVEIATVIINQEQPGYTPIVVSTILRFYPFIIWNFPNSQISSWRRIKI